LSKKGRKRMNKNQVLTRLQECGVVAVVRAESVEKAIKIAEACAEAGIAGLEITYTVPGATEVIKALSEKYSDGKIIVGAGTVLDPETARIAILAGAQFIVSPGLNVETIKLANTYQVATMPGCMTPTEAITAMNAGADVVKIFPGDLFGPNIIKDLKGPLPQGNFMPSGGVTLENCADWIKAGAVAVSTGSSLTAGAKKGDYASITELGKQYIQKVKEAREAK
jgi:2-dehydro-3-deoxyphosphogluconate aldolase/(4S)-4-hydroxy-2-oxoglutarate aldolase